MLATDIYYFQAITQTILSTNQCLLRVDLLYIRTINLVLSCDG